MYNTNHDGKRIRIEEVRIIVNEVHLKTRKLAEWHGMV